MLFGLAVLWFLPGIWWGLPHVTDETRVRAWGPDETGPHGGISIVQLLLGHPNYMSPQYAAGHYFVQALFAWPYRLLVLAADNIGLPRQYESQQVMMLLHRLPSLLMAAGTVVVARRLGAGMAGAAAGWFAAAAVATMGPLAFYARTSNLDAPALLWFALALLVLVDVLRSGLSVPRAAFLGVCAAIGTATKDQSYTLFAAIALAAVAAHVAATRRGGSWRHVWRAPAAGAGVAIALYGLASGALLLPDFFRSHLEFLKGDYRPQDEELRRLAGSWYSYAATLSGYTNLGVDVARQVNAAVGPGVLLLAAIGAWATARREPRLLWLLLPAVVLLAGVVAPVRFVRPRFLLPVNLILCLLAGCGAVVLMGAGGAVRRAALAGLALAIGWPALRAADLTYQMIFDSRYEAGEWLRSHVAPGDTVAYFGSVVKLPALPRTTVITPAPGERSFGRESRILTQRPAFIISAPQQIAEPVFERSAPDSIMHALLDGTGGYRQVLAVQRSAIWPRPLLLASFVNPPVRVFARDDVAARLGHSPRLELPDPRCFAAAPVPAAIRC